MNYRVGILLLTVFAACNSPISKPDKAENPLCRKWKFSSAQSNTVTQGKDTLSNKNIDVVEQANRMTSGMGMAFIQYNNDGSYEAEELVSLVETKTVKGTWIMTDDHKIIETNAATGQKDTLSVVQLTTNTLVVRITTTDGSNITRTFVGEY